MQCKICNEITVNYTEAKIMNKYNIKYFHCQHCEFIQTEEPYWLEEAYSETINLTDTGIMKRNQILADFATIIIYLFFNRRKKFLDYAGGYGIFTRLMRDIGFDMFWNDKYTKNLVARGFNYSKNEQYELLTSFESFEHFLNPLEDVESMLSISDNILISTTLTPTKMPLPTEWDYYALEHGQHISFYSIKTMQYIANKYNLNFYTNGKNIHLFTKKRMNNGIFNILYICSRLGFANLFKPFLKSKILSDAKLLLKTRG